jgi:hypothetical protein
LDFLEHLIHQKIIDMIICTQSIDYVSHLTSHTI